jgi:diazepam-binding inhibitor (GABA receptor modulator, acyl-CoA-binding protein)
LFLFFALTKQIMDETLQNAEARLRTLTTAPTNEELLEIYALYKQALLGDCLQPKPGIFDVKAQFKWKAWKAKAGLSQRDATVKYAQLVDKLLEKYA